MKFWLNHPIQRFFRAGQGDWVGGGRLLRPGAFKRVFGFPVLPGG